MLCKPMFGIAILFLEAVMCTACADRHAAEVSSDTFDAVTNDDALRDLRLTVARDRVMLHHTRYILKLAEADTATQSNTGNSDELSAIAADQVRLAVTLSAYTGAVCGQRHFPVPVRDAACSIRARNSGAFLMPAAPNVAALSARAEAVDDLVGSWWGTVCEFAPPASTPTEAVCVLE